MRTWGPRVLVLAALAVALATGTALAGAAAPTRPCQQATARCDAGIKGLVQEAPTCPVERAGGPPCTAPYRGRIDIRSVPAGTLVEVVRCDQDGHFHVLLPAGRYVIVARRAFDRSEHHVGVRAHRFTHVHIVLDTGIR